MTMAWQSQSHFFLYVIFGEAAKERKIDAHHKMNK